MKRLPVFRALRGSSQRLTLSVAAAIGLASLALVFGLAFTSGPAPSRGLALAAAVTPAAASPGPKA